MTSVFKAHEQVVESVIDGQQDGEAGPEVLLTVMIPLTFFAIPPPEGRIVRMSLLSRSYMYV